jgi:hypothetical protein
MHTQLYLPTEFMMTPFPIHIHIQGSERPFQQKDHRLDLEVKRNRLIVPFFAFSHLSVFQNRYP